MKNKILDFLQNLINIAPLLEYSENDSKQHVDEAQLIHAMLEEAKYLKDELNGVTSIKNMYLKEELLQKRIDEIDNGNSALVSTMYEAIYKAMEDYKNQALTILNVLLK